jgi:serine/threonine protein kinase
VPGAPSAQDSSEVDSSSSSALERPRLRYRFPTVERENYEILGEIAVGGIGRIRRAREDRLGRPVAIKELLGEASAVVEARFVREALITARLQHPSIIPIYEAGRWPSGELFYAMKLVDGRSLAEVLEGRSYAQRLELLPHVLSVAEAIAYAHSRRILHRDLKPSNILVGKFGETLVIDWGLAKDISEHQQPPVSGLAPARGLAFDSYSREGTASQSLTMTGAVIGTPAYMPPEQAAGTAVDERADVYAIGAILYHVLAGCPPYGGGSPMDIVRRVLAGPPTPLQQHQRGIAQDLSTIVEKAMARAPLTRYPTALELADDLRRLQTGQIVGAHVYSSSDLVRRFACRHRATLLVALVALAVIAALGVVGLRRIFADWRRAETQQTEAHRIATVLPGHSGAGGETAITVSKVESSARLASRARKRVDPMRWGRGGSRSSGARRCC